MEESGVTFKGTTSGLTIIMREEETLESILTQIEAKIHTAGKFFKGAVIKVKYRGKKLTSEQEQKIVVLLDGKSGARIQEIEYDPEEVNYEITKTKEKTLKEKIKMRTFSFEGITEGPTKFHKGTVRSGQLIDFDGNIVILGDVNPGSELIATGNIVVMGALRGLCHAGADGNKDAVVASLNLSPTQLRIADVITRAPEEMVDKSLLVPEMAYIKGNTIMIERYLPPR